MESLSTCASRKGRGLGKVFAIAACLLAVCINYSGGTHMDLPNFECWSIYENCLSYVIGSTDEAGANIVREIVKESLLPNDIVRHSLSKLQSNCTTHVRPLQHIIEYVLQEIEKFVQAVMHSSTALIETEVKRLQSNGGGYSMEDLNTVYGNIYHLCLSNSDSMVSIDEAKMNIVRIILMNSFNENASMEDITGKFKENCIRALSPLQSTLDYVSQTVNKYIIAVMFSAEAEVRKKKWQEQLNAITSDREYTDITYYKECLLRAIGKYYSSTAQHNQSLVFSEAITCMTTGDMKLKAIICKLMDKYVELIGKLENRDRSDVKLIMEAYIEDLINNAAPAELSVNLGAMGLSSK